MRDIKEAFLRVMETFLELEEESGNAESLEAPRYYFSCCLGSFKEKPNEETEGELAGYFLEILDSKGISIGEEARKYFERKNERKNNLSCVTDQMRSDSEGHQLYHQYRGGCE